MARMGGSTVAIIGGGFSGTVAAIRLLATPDDGSPSLPFGSKVVLIEPGRAGEGLAYRAGPDYWRLNVPAARMSAFAEHPDDFVAWARARDPRVSGDNFLPRAWYGDYLAERLDLAHRRSPRWLAFEHVRQPATAIELTLAGARIALANGNVLEADRVLLTLGNAPWAAPIADGPEIVDDAWDLRWMERLPTYVPRVLLVGTGLTMIDQVLAIADRRPDTRLLAISRHGLLPLPHEEAKPMSLPRFETEALLARGPLSQRLRRFRAVVNGDGGNWRAAVQQVREAMPVLWRTAPWRVRRQFLRHLRAYWDVHRHRAPRATLARIQTLRERKRLEIVAGRLVEARRIKGGILVRWRPRGSDLAREELVDAIVNVTGPDGNPRRSRCPLVQSLVKQGLCQPDGLGWGTDPHGRLLDANGLASTILYYVGPFLRARHLEAIAVPELRVHAARTAAAVAASLARGTGSLLRRVVAPAFRRESLPF